MKRIVLIIACSILLLLTSTWATPIPDTGQTKCYDNTQEISCPQPGEDFYGQDGNYDINTQSYTKLDANGNDLPVEATEWVMVRDDVTGLIWQKDTEPGTYTWQQAIDYCDNLVLGVYSDWHLPTIKELSTLVESSIPYPGPTINIDYFPNTVSSSYWSSTNYPGISYQAWIVNFGDCKVSNLPSNDNRYVRAVRGGQCGSLGNFIDNGDETVTDTDIGLMWQKTTAPRIYTWEGALEYCDTTFAGYNDWRLPNRNELQSIVDYSRYDPAIDPIFNTRTSYYWSSTTDAEYSSDAWLVGFRSGNILSFGKSGSGHYSYVRAVRGGLCGLFGDSDGDTVCNDVDNCIDDYNPFQYDCDDDGEGDICDADTIDPDGDGVDVTCDNCPTISNPNQKDTDGSGIGDACNNAIDADDDEWEDSFDNCPTTPNPNQEDTYPPQGNGIGDACDCEANFDCDQDVDANDVTAFLTDFGRSIYNRPCTNEDPCKGDFSCDGDVDATDVTKFLEDFGRSQYNNPCPVCVIGNWCVY